MSSDEPTLSLKDILTNPQGIKEMLQSKIRTMQEDLARKKVEGSAGGGLVVAVASGQQRLLGLRIDPEVLEQEDLVMLQDLVVAAVNQALENAAKLAQEELGKTAMGMGLQIPGIF